MVHARSDLIGAGLIAGMFSALGASGCSSDGDPYLDEVRAELSTGTFACGVERCMMHEEYCVVTTDEIGVERHACAGVPLTCRTSVCECVSGDWCFEDGGRVTVTSHR